MINISLLHYTIFILQYIYPHVQGTILFAAHICLIALDVYRTNWGNYRAHTFCVLVFIAFIRRFVTDRGPSVCKYVYIRHLIEMFGQMFYGDLIAVNNN